MAVEKEGVNKVIDKLITLNVDIDYDKVVEYYNEAKTKCSGRVIIAYAVVKYLIETGRTNYDPRELENLLCVDLKKLKKYGLQYRFKLKVDDEKVKAEFEKLKKIAEEKGIYNFGERTLYAVAHALAYPEMKVKDIAELYKVSEPAMRLTSKKILGKSRLRWGDENEKSAVE